MREKLILLVGIIAVIIFMVFAVNAAKNLSYSFFYKDMVKETIREMTKSEALK